jgi:hypothetical protein
MEKRAPTTKSRFNTRKFLGQPAIRQLVSTPRGRRLAFGAGANGAEGFRTDEALPAGEPKTFYDATYEITYLDAHFASLVFSIGTYEGGAHPNGGSSSLLFDFDRGRSLMLADFLEDSEEAIPAIAARCSYDANKEDWGVFENADFAAVVSAVSAWSVDRTAWRSGSIPIR